MPPVLIKPFLFIFFSGHPKENVDDILVEEIMSKAGFVNHAKRDDWRDFIRNCSKDCPPWCNCCQLTLV